MRWDKSPWIVNRATWQGIEVQQDPDTSRASSQVVRLDATSPSPLDTAWWCRNDTFPGNLALFTTNNVALDSESVSLVLRRENRSVRNYTSGAVASRSLFTFGRYEAVVKPARGSGLITGIFLHRNSPRQEIDIEFLGRDTTKMLVNVYYNPGPVSTRLEYGYRGTPVLIELGYDAAEDFHRYAVEWRSEHIQWFVDGRLVHKRDTWDPTPIPHLPMEFNVNLWHSRSTALAGRLRPAVMPATAEIRSIHIEAEAATRHADHEQWHAVGPAR